MWVCIILIYILVLHMCKHYFLLYHTMRHKFPVAMDFWVPV